MIKKKAITEVSSLIRQQIDKYQSTAFKYENVGVVLQVGDGIARIFGLSDVMAGELIRINAPTVEDPQFAVVGIALNLERNNVGVVLMGQEGGVTEGALATGTGKIAEVPVGSGFLGRVVNGLAEPIDGKRQIDSSEYRLIESGAPGIIDRKSVCEPLQTGITVIDALVPVGRGQRELIIGDRQTGKTSVAIDTILNQRFESNVVCVYVAIGQKASSVASVVGSLREGDALSQTIIVVANADDPATLQYIAPYTGAALAEYFMYDGMATLVVYDDLTKQASAYRQMSLLLRRPPGREAYPGDVFYLHSRLLERAAKLGDGLGGGSMTALPIVETQAGDVSAYIPTNVISITDGQIFLSGDLFNSGIRPAINIGISVSRVGSAAQTKAMKGVAGKLKLELAQFAELEAFSQFASDLDQSTKDQLARGERLREMLKQDERAPFSVQAQILMIYCVTRGLLDAVPISKVRLILSDLLRVLRRWFVDLEKEGLFSEVACKLDPFLKTDACAEAWSIDPVLCRQEAAFEAEGVDFFECIPDDIDDTRVVRKLRVSRESRFMVSTAILNDILIGPNLCTSNTYSPIAAAFLDYVSRVIIPETYLK